MWLLIFVELELLIRLDFEALLSVLNADIAEFW
jgi:hypothetical protein